MFGTQGIMSGNQGNQAVKGLVSISACLGACFALRMSLFGVDLLSACRYCIYEPIFYFHGRLCLSWNLPWGAATRTAPVGCTALPYFSFQMTLCFHNSRIAVFPSHCTHCTGFTCGSLLRCRCLVFVCLLVLCFS